MPAPRFYVSAESVIHKYCEYRKDREGFHTNRNQELLLTLFKRYEQLRDLYGKNVCQCTIMEAIVKEQAPSFFLTPESAVVFYYRAMKNKRKKAKL